MVSVFVSVDTEDYCDLKVVQIFPPQQASDQFCWVTSTSVQILFVRRSELIAQLDHLPHLYMPVESPEIVEFLIQERS